MKAVKYLLLTLNLLFSTIIYGQNFNYRIFSPIEISPSDELRCIYFDHQGLMWIGTNSGLKSYNGYSMTTYKSDAFSPVFCQIIPCFVSQKITTTDCG